MGPCRPVQLLPIVSQDVMPNCQQKQKFLSIYVQKKKSALEPRCPCSRSSTQFLKHEVKSSIVPPPTPLWQAGASESQGCLQHFVCHWDSLLVLMSTSRWREALEQQSIFNRRAQQNDPAEARNQTSQPRVQYAIHQAAMSPAFKLIYWEHILNQNG